ncbi:MAG: hypothetical protein FWF59_14760 [Turicibacter sp.]|nr:hypothetical protein [Turicibacter sp.]
MKTQSKGNLRIDGVGSHEGGVFDRIEFNGVGTLKGGVQADEISVNGVGTFNGDVATGHLGVDGMCTFNSQVQADTLDINGTAKINGGLGVGTLNVNGNLKINGGMKGDTMTNNGRLVVTEDCELEAFRSDGLINVSGSLNAETVELNIALKCQVREIGGSQITVRQIGTASFLESFFPTFLQADTIEGDIIQLEATKAKKVSGHEIIIGENCDIDVVEYTGTYQQSPSARVREARNLA